MLSYKHKHARTVWRHWSRKENNIGNRGLSDVCKIYIYIFFENLQYII